MPSAFVNNSKSIGIPLARDAESIPDNRKRPRVDLLSRALEWVPFLDSSPHVLARVLGCPADRGQVDAGNDAIAHAHDAINDDGYDIVADPALHQSFNRVADRAKAQAVARLEIDYHDIGFGTRRQPAQVRAPECPRASECRGFEHLGCGRGGK